MTYHQEPLDRYLNEHFDTKGQWYSFFRKHDDEHQVNRYVALADTVAIAGRIRVGEIRREKGSRI